MARTLRQAGSEILVRIRETPTSTSSLPRLNPDTRLRTTMSSSETNQRSTSSTSNRFDYSIFHSDVSFTIELASTEFPWQRKLVEPEPVASKYPFYVHRSMLASMSPEMAKHVNNAMKEGQEKAILFHDVDYVTMQRVIQWGYAKTYETEMEGPASLFLHIRIYSFASRFNIAALQDVAFQGALSELKNIGKPKTTLELREFKGVAKDIRPMMIQILEYAFDNLPISNGCTPEQLLELLTSYVGWGLMAFREDSDFKLLLAKSPDFGIAVMEALEPHRYPLWQLRDTTHVLSRRQHGPGCRYFYTGPENFGNTQQAAVVKSGIPLMNA
ncbi:hypothetical protein BDZ91DRAFT_799055 [Kalaharituber pfeilii]|nr:hypothetical protein BDZ91DRAFT_799055 [Kalaharituber pfeilii]